MRSVIRFLNARNIKPADIHRQLCEVYGDDAIIDGMVRRWVRKFNEGRISVHDEQHTGRPSLINDDLVRVVDEKIHEDRRFIISSLSLNFPQMLRSGSQAGEFYNEGIERLVPRLDKSLNNGGDYGTTSALVPPLYECCLIGLRTLGYIEIRKFQLHTEPRPQIVSSTELLSIVRSRNMFAFSSDERAFNIESYFRTGTVRLPTSYPDFPYLLLLAPL
ncbi:hypothetical protein ANN_09188 [Periplaneta americana]|uniref:Mos1 transposase HTH domain-containing protein n=1 Tax=Periplaneta americana TaxID=6978 RepID=A0ABQ8TME8_PERAM|nr:hypothetical protein ANN_09188 [Periplaneta americana]